MIHRVKIAQDAQCTEGGTHDQEGQIAPLKGKPSPLRIRRTAAKMTATKLRKKLFWIDGRSPESLTNRLMSEKKAADAMMRRIPL